jgi:hypothetical protein
MEWTPPIKLNNRRCADFQRQSDTTVGQLLVEFELKDLKTGFHRTPSLNIDVSIGLKISNVARVRKS